MAKQPEPPRFTETGVRVPTPATLKTYGLTEDDWREILDRQDGTCAICGNVPASGILHIDHHHIRGWKAMHPNVRRLYVRGLVCQFDNRFVLARNMQAWRLRAAADYLDAHTARLEAAA